MKVKSLVSKVGSKAKIASLLNISAAAVSQWGDKVPELRKYQLKEIMKSEPRVKNKAA